jgi:hypothetical protein
MSSGLLQALVGDGPVRDAPGYTAPVFEDIVPSYLEPGRYYVFLYTENFRTIGMTSVVLPALSQSELIGKLHGYFDLALSSGVGDAVVNTEGDMVTDRDAYLWVAYILPAEMPAVAETAHENISATRMVSHEKRLAQAAALNIDLNALAVAVDTVERHELSSLRTLLSETHVKYDGVHEFGAVGSGMMTASRARHFNETHPKFARHESYYDPWFLWTEGKQKRGLKLVDDPVRIGRFITIHQRIQRGHKRAHE